MARRCPSCNKFCPLTTECESQDGPNIDEEGTITGSVRVFRTSECCSEEMTEATFDYEVETHIDVETHQGEGHELTVDAQDPEPTETGGSRYKKNMVGFSMEASVRCSCQKESDAALWEGTIEDAMAASQFDELV